MTGTFPEILSMWEVDRRMCKEDVEKWLDELIRVKNEYNKIPALTDEIETVKSLWITIVSGADKVAETLGVPYRETESPHPDYYFVSFSYGGYQFGGCIKK